MKDEDRICYKSTESAAITDKSIYQSWMDGLLSTRMATQRLSISVGYNISEDQFVKNANWLGYRRKK